MISTPIRTRGWPYAPLFLVCVQECLINCKFVPREWGASTTKKNAHTMTKVKPTSVYRNHEKSSFQIFEFTICFWSFSWGRISEKLICSRSSQRQKNKHNRTIFFKRQRMVLSSPELCFFGCVWAPSLFMENSDWDIQIPKNVNIFQLTVCAGPSCPCTPLV